MSTRQELLLRIFRLLRVQQIPYVVSRNYEDIFESHESDVDLLARSEDVSEIIDCCCRAARWRDYQLVQKTRFANYSLVFWNSAEEFLRIDIDTEIRWRLQHVLAAGQILYTRRRYGEFFVPDPKHESVVILTKAIWVGFFSERYAGRLKELAAEIPDQDELADVYNSCFGIRENILDQPLDDALCARLRRSLAGRTFRSPRHFLTSARYVFEDVRRVCGRLFSPPGISLHIVTANELNHDEVINPLQVLFPVQKGLLRASDVSIAAIFKKLFRGGLVLELQRVRDDIELGRRLRKPPLEVYPSRAFFSGRASGGKAYFAHAGTGCMGTFDPTKSDVDIDSACGRFIARALAKQEFGQSAGQHGAFAVVVGLDGSGKTTFARQVCTAVADDSRFAGVRYFHWIPRAFGRIEFPFPTFENTPRKEPLSQNPVNAVFSALRLFRNVVRANLSYRLGVRPLIARNYLVIADRYFYNYWLDPVSVKYAGPGWLLDLALKFFPKPDYLVVLKADATTLLARKRELSSEEIAEQIQRLDRLPIYGRRIDLDALRSPEELAQTVFEAIGGQKNGR